MADWNYSPESPITLTLAADARCGTTTYANDQIWELSTGTAEPPALALLTTFGLRARSCRIFPRFISGDGQVAADPAHFFRPINIKSYYPNYINIFFKPFSFINVEIEYWVPSSQVITGRIKITNTSHDPRNFQLEWAELLVPSPHGSRMAVSKIGLSTILSGKTGDLAPVFLLTGGVQAGSSPYPSLAQPVELKAHEVYESRWVNASLEDTAVSFELAKEVINRSWEAEFARIRRVNAQQVQITTGNQDWNNAIQVVQTVAQQLILQPINGCPSASYVYSRNPDQGYSIRKDGSDYNHLWNGQTAFDCLYLTNFLLPSSPELVRGLLDNFLASQTESGEIDWKPGLSGQRSQVQATPLLATLAWLIYQYTGDQEYLKRIYTQLTKFYFSWFIKAHDRDKDFIPEWDQAIQTGFEEHPLFSASLPWSAGVDISTVEGPDLISYLYQENRCLSSIAELLKDDDVLHQLAQISQYLLNAIDKSWNDEHACYHYWDRDTHLTTQGEVLCIQKGSGILEIHQEFNQPIRPMMIIKSKREGTHPIQVYIHGTTPAGSHRVERIPTQRIRWQPGTGFITSEYVYRAIEQIEIMGILDDVEVTVQSIDLTALDQTLLLPLWASIPTCEKAKVLVNLTVLNKKKFLSPFGLRSTLPKQSMLDVAGDRFAIHLPMISLILEGMIKYGMYDQAAEVFTRLMNAVIQSFRKDLKFYQSHNSETGAQLGVVNTLPSLLPVGLFLKIIGVNITSPTKVEIINGNPFPWPVTIKYQGLTVVQQEKKTLIIFPDGQNISVDNNRPQCISM